MNQYSTSFSLLLDRLDSLSVYCAHAKANPPKVSFFKRKRHRVECRLLASSVVDVQRHAAALIGYFEGYDARGACQDTFIDAQGVHNLSSCLEIMEYVVSNTRLVVQRCSQGDGVMVTNGPTKPGPQRTLVVACEHIEGIIIQLKRILGVLNE